MKRILFYVFWLILPFGAWGQVEVLGTNFDCRPKEINCNDGIDNDGDGAADCDDIDCLESRLNQAIARNAACLACSFDSPVFIQNLVDEHIYQLTDKSGNLYSYLGDLQEIKALFERCESTNWSSYKGKGIVPECLWENAPTNVAFTMGVADGAYSEVKEIYEFIAEFDKNVKTVNAILIQLIVAANPRYYGCNDGNLLCQYEDWLEVVRDKIACELTCMEVDDLKNEVFKKENILKGCELEQQLKDAIKNLREFIDNEEAMIVLGMQANNNITKILEKLAQGDNVTVYKAGKITGIIGLNFFPLTAVTKSGKVKELLAYLNSLTNQQLDDLGNFIVDVFDKFSDFYDGLSDAKKAVYSDATKILPINTWKKVVDDPELLDIWAELRKLRTCPSGFTSNAISRSNTPCKYNELLKYIYEGQEFSPQLKLLTRQLIKDDKYNSSLYDALADNRELLLPYRMFWLGALRKQWVRTNVPLLERVNQKNLTNEQMEALAIFYKNLKLGGSTNPPPFDLTKKIELTNGLIKNITVHYDEFGFPRFTDHMPEPKRTYAFMEEDYPEGFTQLAATSTDFKHANNKLAEVFGCQPNTNCNTDNFIWDGNATYFTRKEDGKLVRYTWHHHQDGKSLIAVPSAINNPDLGGFSHTGGNKLINTTVPKGELIGFFSSPTF